MIDTYPDTLAVVEYFYNDPPYSTSWGQARAGFHGVASVGIPFFGYDGLWDAWPIGTFVSKFVTRQAVSTDVTIALGGVHVEDNRYRVSARVCLEADALASRQIRFHAVQVLDHYPSSPSYYRNVFRQAASTANFVLEPGACELIERTFDLNADMSQKDDIKIIVWAQAPGSSAPAEVFQAAKMAWPFPPPQQDLPGDMDGSGTVDIDDVDAMVLALIDRDAYGLAYDVDPDVTGDFTDDGQCDGSDLAGFVQTLLAG